MEALGAAEDAIQLRSVMALADLSAGRLDEAAEELDRIAAGEHTDRTIGWSVAGISGQAELALARGEVDRGLSAVPRVHRHRAQPPDARHRHPGGPDAVGDVRGVLRTVRARPARPARGRADLASELRGVLPQLLDENGPHVDFPVWVACLLALGTWDLTGGVGVAETSLRMTRSASASATTARCRPWRGPTCCRCSRRWTRRTRHGSRPWSPSTPAAGRRPAGRGLGWWRAEGGVGARGTPHLRSYGSSLASRQPHNPACAHLSRRPTCRTRPPPPRGPQPSWRKIPTSPAVRPHRQRREDGDHGDAGDHSPADLRR